MTNDEARMDSTSTDYANECEPGFRSTLLVVVLVHVVALVCIMIAARYWKTRPAVEQVLWLEGGSLPGLPAAPPATPVFKAAVPELPAPDAVVEVPVPEDGLPVPPEKSEDELALTQLQPTPTPTPQPTPTPTPRPVATATPRPATTPTPRPKPSTPTPRPVKTSKPTPRPTPRPPKKPAPDKPVTPKPKAPASTDAAPTTKPTTANSSAAPGNGESQAGNAPSTGSATGKPGTGPGTGTGNKSGPGTANGGMTETQLAVYFGAVGERFKAVWDQPVTVVSTGRKLVAYVRIQVQRDGTVSSVRLASGSGSREMDESIEAAFAKFKKVPPPPEPLLKNGVMDETMEVRLDL